MVLVSNDMDWGKMNFVLEHTLIFNCSSVYCPHTKWLLARGMPYPNMTFGPKEIFPIKQQIPLSPSTIQSWNGGLVFLTTQTRGMVGEIAIIVM